MDSKEKMGEGVKEGGGDGLVLKKRRWCQLGSGEAFEGESTKIKHHTSSLTGQKRVELCGSL